MKVHVLQHAFFEGIGSIGAWIESGDHQVCFTRFFECAILPSLDDFDLLIVLGGPMGANDENEFSWLNAEKHFLAKVIASGKPVLGICLGAQLIASCLGARVYRAPQPEIGWFPVWGSQKSAGSFWFPEEIEVLHWHRDTFDLPDGAIHLATSAACRNQAFQIGAHVIGLQFHLEATPESAAAMVKSCGDDLRPQAFVQTGGQLLAVSSETYSAANALIPKVLGYLMDPRNERK